MNRRQILLGTAATAAVLPLKRGAFAQAAAIEADKMDALMGGDFATATSQLALQKANHRAVKTFAEREIAE